MKYIKYIFYLVLVSNLPIKNCLADIKTNRLANITHYIKDFIWQENKSVIKSDELNDYVIFQKSLGKPLYLVEKFGYDFSYTDLSLITALNLNLSHMIFDGTNFAFASLHNIDFTCSSMSNINANNADFSNSILNNVNMKNSNLSDTKFVNSSLIGANLNNVDFKGANLAGADLANADLSGADLAGANLGGANLTGAILNGANLTRAILDKVKAYRTDFSNANLTMTSFIGARINTSSFKNAIFDNTNFIKADLRGSQLKLGVSSNKKDIIINRKTFYNLSDNPQLATRLKK